MKKSGLKSDLIRSVSKKSDDYDEKYVKKNSTQMINDL